MAPDPTLYFCRGPCLLCSCFFSFDYWTWKMFVITIISSHYITCKKKIEKKTIPYFFIYGTIQISPRIDTYDEYFFWAISTCKCKFWTDYFCKQITFIKCWYCYIDLDKAILIKYQYFSPRVPDQYGIRRMSKAC